MAVRNRYALWLAPDAGAAGAFSGLIERLARQYRGPRFLPHVTLIGWLMGDEQALAEKTALLAARLQPQQLRVNGLVSEPYYFRCLYARLDLSNGLREAHRAASKDFGVGYGDGFLPHLSLYYGRLDKTAKGRLGGELNGAVPRQFDVNQLQLVRIAVDIADWRVVASHPLGESASPSFL